MDPFYKIDVSRELIAQVLTEGFATSDNLQVCEGLPIGYELKHAHYNGSVLVLLFGPLLAELSDNPPVVFLAPLGRRERLGNE